MQRFALPAALALALGIVALAAGGGAFARLCGAGPLRSLGRYSYCVYLVHFLVIDEAAHALRAWSGDPARPETRPPVLQWLAAHASPTLLLVAFTATCVAASWTIGFASWHLYERPFLALKRRFPTAPLPPPP
jgi:peptidoglycan/LPS O-acetylase OafA/YrhL